MHRNYVFLAELIYIYINVFSQKVTVNMDLAFVNICIFPLFSQSHMVIYILYLVVYLTSILTGVTDEFR